MRIQRMVRKYVFIMSCVVLVSFGYKNIVYAESKTNIQLYVPDDTQTSVADNNKRTETSKVKTGDEAGAEIWNYQILLATSAVLGIMGVVIGKRDKKEWRIDV